MSDFSPQDLDEKISAFTTRKFAKFPELHDKHYVEKVEHESREGISRSFFPTTMHFGAQY